MSDPTLQDMRDFHAEITAKFGAATLGIANVTRTQFSIARHYGAINFNGHLFMYNSADDSLIRLDVVKWIIKRKKSAKKPVKAEVASQQQGLQFENKEACE